MQIFLTNYEVKSNSPIIFYSQPTVGLGPLLVNLPFVYLKLFFLCYKKKTQSEKIKEKLNDATSLLLMVK